MNSAKIEITCLLILSAFFLCSCSTLNNNQNQLAIAKNLAKNGLYKESLQIYKNLLKKHPKREMITRNMGFIYFKLSDFPKSYTLLKSVLKYYSDDFTTFFFLGESSRGLGNYSKAKEYLSLSVALNKNHLESRVALSWVNFKLNNFKSSKRLAYRILTKWPENLDAKIILLNNFIKNKNLKNAKELIQKNLNRKDFLNSPAVLALTGDFFKLQKKYKSAESFYKQALKIRPLQVESLLGLAHIYLLSSNTHPQAAIIVKRILNIAPNRLSSSPELMRFIASKK